MYHLINFGPQFLKKFDQIIKRVKWSKLGFWLRKGNFWFFNLESDQLSSSMISRIQWHHLDLITCLKTSQIHWIDRWSLQSIDQKSTVYWKVKLWLFGQNQVPRVKIHQNMSKCETCSSRNQRFKIWFWNLKFFLT